MIEITAILLYVEYNGQQKKKMASISLAEAIKNKIDTKAFSYRKLANIINVDHAFLYNIVKGIKPPPKNREFLKKVAVVLGIDSEELLEYKQMILVDKISSDKDFTDLAYELLGSGKEEHVDSSMTEEAALSEDIDIDEATFRVTAGEKLLALTYKEFQLLLYLYRNSGYVISRDAILREVWGYDYFGGTRTVDVHIRRLRFKLGPKFQDKIETVRNIGYRFKSQSKKSAPA